MSDKPRSQLPFRVMLLVHLVLGIGSLVGAIMLMGGATPYLQEMYDEYELTLSRLTLSILFLSRYWYLLLPLGFLGFVVDLTILYGLSRLSGKLRWFSLAWFVSVLAVMVVFAILMTVGLLLPFFNLLQELSG